MSRGGFSGKALFAVVVWGASFVATRIALSTFTPAGLVASRLVSAWALLAAIGLLTGRPLLPPRRDWTLYAILGLVLGLHLLLQSEGLEFTSAINTGWIIAFTPVPIAIGGRIFLRQRLGALGWAGIAAGSAGILSIVVAATPGFAQARTGDALQLASCLTWTIYTLGSAPAVARNGALAVSTNTMGVAAVLLLAAGAPRGYLAGPLTTASLVAIAFLGFVCGSLAYVLWYAAVNERGAAAAGSYLYLEPFVTVAASAALLAEPITPSVAIGGVLVLLGVWLVGRDGSRRSGAKEPARPALA